MPTDRARVVKLLREAYTKRTSARVADLYSVDDHTIAHDVRQWALDNGDDPRLRIVLAGYVDEHEDLMPPTWRRHRYSASAAYQTTAGGGVNAANRHKECLWFSPHCLTVPKQAELFAQVRAT